MEHLGSIVPRALNGHAPRGAPLVQRPSPRTLSELAAHFEEDEARENPDVVTPLSTIVARNDGLLEFPKLGAFAPTEWAARQLGSLLGARFDKYFERATGAERAEELNRRLARATTNVRLRTARTVDGANVVRAVVTPGYSPVRDSLVARNLATALGAVEGDVTVARLAETDMTVGFVVQVGRPVRVPEVGDIHGGIFCRNSGVGFSSFVITLFLERLICTNGMCLPVDGGKFVRRRHRGLDEGALTKLLADRFAGLPGRLADGANLLRRSTTLTISNVEATIRAILQRARLPQKLVPQILEAHKREPGYTAFAVLQAFTAAARDVKPEDRFDLEAAAGAYLADPLYAGRIA
jgi:hypothetical protein